MLNSSEVKRVFSEMLEIRREVRALGLNIAAIRGEEFDWSSDSESSLMILGKGGEVRLLWEDGHVELANLMTFPLEYLDLPLVEVIRKETEARIAREIARVCAENEIPL